MNRKPILKKYHDPNPEYVFRNRGVDCDHDFPPESEREYGGDDRDYTYSEWTCSKCGQLINHSIIG